MMPRLPASRLSRSRNLRLVVESVSSVSAAAVSGCVVWRNVESWCQIRRSGQEGSLLGSPGSHPLLVRELVIRASRPFSVVSVTMLVSSGVIRWPVGHNLPSNRLTGQRVSLHS